MRITIFTGTRAEFGLLQPVMRACERRAVDSRSTGVQSRLEWLVSGAHLDTSMGNTAALVQSDRAPVLACVPFFTAGTRASDVGSGITQLGFVLERSVEDGFGKPDWLVVLGDRYESFAATVAATLLGIPVCHVHGGDRANSGHIDETFRHSMTRFAALHCTGSKESADRLRQFGEEHWRIHWVGAPGLDRLRGIATGKEQEVRAAAKEFGEEFLLVVLHPVSTEARQAGDQARWLIGQVDQRPENKLVVLPNNDPGGDAIRAAFLQRVGHSQAPRSGELLRTAGRGGGGWIVASNLDDVAYTAALKYARAFVGNSSSGIIEAPLFGLPMVHTGNRNRDRQNAGHVAFVEWGPLGDTSPSEPRAAAFHDALARSVTDAEHRRVMGLANPYGDGNAAERIAELLWAFRGDPDLLRKMVTY